MYLRISGSRAVTRGALRRLYTTLEKYFQRRKARVPLCEQKFHALVYIYY